MRDACRVRFEGKMRASSQATADRGERYLLLHTVPLAPIQGFFVILQPLEQFTEGPVDGVKGYLAEVSSL
jgi:hypothetical protein